MLGGLGSITYWSFSPAIDLTALYEKHTADANGTVPKTVVAERDSLNVLLVGLSDPSTILLTLSNFVWRRRHTSNQSEHIPKRVRFYVVERSLEALARQMILLQAALHEPPSRMSIDERIDFYLDIYGNTRIRPENNDHLRRLSQYLVQLLTGDAGASAHPLFRFHELRFKERDLLETIFSFWHSHASDSFNMQAAWEARLRQHLQTRYDHAENIFDWDFHITYLTRGGECITPELYKHWRKTGNAFPLRSHASYVAANPTLASVIVLPNAAGERYETNTRQQRLAEYKKRCLGYWGDTITGPFCALGLDRGEKYEVKRSMTHMRTAAHIAKLVLDDELCKLLFDKTPPDRSHQAELAKYKAQQQKSKKAKQKREKVADSFSTITEEEEDADTSGKTKEEKSSIEENAEAEQTESPDDVENFELVEDDDRSSHMIQDIDEAAHTEKLNEGLAGCDITWLGPKELDDLSTKPNSQKWKNHFDVAVISCSLQSLVMRSRPQLNRMLRPGALAVVETCRTILEVNDKQLDELGEAISKSLASTAAGSESVDETCPVRDISTDERVWNLVSGNYKNDYRVVYKVN